MGGRITIEGRKQPSKTVSQLLTPRSQASTSLTRLSTSPRSPRLPATVSLPSNHTTVQRINVRLHKLSKYRPRPKKLQERQVESPEFPHLSSTERHLSGSESVSDNLTEALPSSRTEQRTYKLLRYTMWSFGEGSGSARHNEFFLLECCLTNCLRRHRQFPGYGCWTAA